MLLLALFSLLIIGACIPQHTSVEVCEPLPCENEADCYNTAEETLSSWCQPNPCHNGGVCEVEENSDGYLCKCPAGFNGVHCQHNINECETSPCRNGGTCTDLTADYSCKCTGEYMGKNCQYTSYIKGQTVLLAVTMLSKHGSQSSLRASLNSLKLLFDSPLERSVRSVGGNGSSTPLLLTPKPRRTNVTSPDELSITQEDTLAYESEDSVSVNESKDTISNDEIKDTVSKASTLPDAVEGTGGKDGTSEAETVSVASKNEDVITLPFEMVECCTCECSGPLGMEGGVISNQQITGSSTHRALFGMQKWFPYYARLNKKGLVNAWSPAESDRWPWLQINLQRRMRVTGVITQGAKRLGSPEYVKTYKVAYSDDGKTWSTLKVKDTDEDMIFAGNTDNNTPSVNSFSPPVESQYIRIFPQVCRKHCSLRMELLGCELTGCSEPMGMKTGYIQDYQITSSSVFQTLSMGIFSWDPSKARLDKQGKVNAWTSAHNDQAQWLQVDLLLPTKVTGIISQGAKDFGHVQFVGSYKLAYSNDGEKWLMYQDEKQQADKIFQGNFDNETHRKNVIDPPIFARFVRIIPWSWYGRITMRVELLGCPEE